MLEELKQTWEEALLKLLKEYQAAHPEDKDLQNAMAEVEGKKPEPAPAQPKAPAAYQTAPAAKTQAAAKNVKAGTFTLAG